MQTSNLKKYLKGLVNTFIILPKLLPKYTPSDKAVSTKVDHFFLHFYMS